MLLLKKSKQAKHELTDSLKALSVSVYSCTLNISFPDFILAGVLRSSSGWLIFQSRV